MAMMNRDPFCQKLFEREDSKDLVLVAGNGAELKCHRLIFEAQSDALAAMVAPGTGRVKMPENSEEGLGHLIRYLYGLKIPTQDMTFDVVVELFKIAHQYQLMELQEHLQCLISRNVTNLRLVWFSPDEILELYFHVKDGNEFENFRVTLLRVMTGMHEKLQSCDRYKELTREDLAHLLWKLFETEKMKTSGGGYCCYCNQYL